MELESVFKEPGVLGSPLSNYRDSLTIVIVYPKVDVFPSVSKTTRVKLHVASSPPHLEK
jgi:hypothetical protein